MKEWVDLLHWVLLGVLWEQHEKNTVPSALLLVWQISIYCLIQCSIFSNLFAGCWSKRKLRVCLLKEKVFWCILLLKQETLFIVTSVSQEILGSRPSASVVLISYVNLRDKKKLNMFFWFSHGSNFATVTYCDYILPKSFQHRKATSPPMIVVQWKIAEACKGNVLVLVWNPFFTHFSVE